MATSYQNALILDFGNSRLKARFVDLDFARSFDITETYDAPWLSRVVSYISAAEGKTFVAISSVNPPKESEFTLAVEGYDDIKIALSKDLLNFCDIDFSIVEGFGLDRAFGLNGALGASASPLITVDCGTAITVNALNENKVFIGGAIMPGFSAQFQALYEKTQALPLTTLDEIPEPLGANTLEAIKSGVYYSAIGGVFRIIKKIRINYLPELTPNVIITGGGAYYMQRGLSEANIECAVIHDLVLNGIERALKAYLSA